MNVLLIGGGGFIGSSIVKQLLLNDHNVTIISRGLSKPLYTSHPKIENQYGDRNDYAFMHTIAKKNYDIVIDMTAYSDEDSKNAIKTFKDKIHRFLHTSTVSVYMISKDINNPITEDQDRGKIMEFWAMNPFGMQYGIDKRNCERVLWQAFYSDKFPVTFIRPPYVCGPQDPSKRDYFWIERILDGNTLLIPGSGDYASQIIYVNDLARAYVDLLKCDESIGHAYNVASDEIFSLNDYLDELCNLLNKDPERINVELDVFLKQSFSTSPDGHAFPFNTYRTAIFNLDKIKNAIDFKSTPFKKWMPKTIDWFLNSFEGRSVGYDKRSLEVEFARNWKKERNEFLVNAMES